jgi:hypothetical protein
MALALPQQAQLAQRAVVLTDAGSKSMKTYPILTKDRSRAFAFEVENIYISPATAAYLVTAVDGVANVELRKAFSKSSDVHVEFQYRGQPYVVWEPYGDSSRYWVGPKEETNDVGDITALEAVFRRYRPPLHRALLGDVLTLRFITRFLDRGRHG